MAARFPLRALALINATSLRGDELINACKAFQPSLGFLLDDLREDTHLPFHCLLLWIYGRIGPQTAAALRAFACIACLWGDARSPAWWPASAFPHHFRTAERLLAAEDPPAHWVLAATRGPRSVQRRVGATLKQVESLGDRRHRLLPERASIRLLMGRLETPP